MDIRMPGYDGSEATSDIVAAGLPCKVLILTTFDLDDYVYAGLRAGASGFLLKRHLARRPGCRHPCRLPLDRMPGPEPSPAKLPRAGYPGAGRAVPPERRGP